MGKIAAVVIAVAVLAGCSSDNNRTRKVEAATIPPVESPLPGMPPVLDSSDIYAADRPGELSEVVKGFASRIYVPNTESNTVDVIDPATYKVVDHFRVDGCHSM